MASPVGHALAGIAVAWGADLLPGSRAGRTAAGSAPWYQRAGSGLTLACTVLAAAPDLDLLITGLHRTVTHSFLSVAVVALLAAIAAAGTGQRAARVAMMCALAWASHIGVDWVSADSSNPRGLQILWPFDGTWFISGWDVFPGTERRRLLSEPSIRHNVRALVTEVAYLLPLVLGLWLVRVKALAGLSPELTRGDHPAQ
jgi:membrane-bound metal-dependent hydrolase YbcI (DUF457 family)